MKKSRGGGIMEGDVIWSVALDKKIWIVGEPHPHPPAIICVESTETEQTCNKQKCVSCQPKGLVAM